MTHYALTQLATRGNKQPHELSAAVQAYLDRAKRKYPHCIAYNPEHVPEKPHDNRYRWVEYPKDGMRFTGKVHDIARREDWRMDHTGYYVDSFQDETTCGLVFQLPARSGECMYVPAIQDPWTDGALCDFHSIAADLREAVRDADRMAERYADECREYYAKDAAETRIAEIKQEIADTYAELKALCREVRANCDKLASMELVKQTIRQHARTARRKVAKLRREQHKLEANFWEAVPNY